MANNATKPNPDLERPNRLVGTGQVSDDATGRIGYEWTKGGSPSSNALTSFMVVAQSMALS